MHSEVKDWGEISYLCNPLTCQYFTIAKLTKYTGQVPDWTPRHWSMVGPDTLTVVKGLSRAFSSLCCLAGAVLGVFSLWLISRPTSILARSVACFSSSPGETGFRYMRKIKSEITNLYNRIVPGLQVTVKKQTQALQQPFYVQPM